MQGSQATTGVRVCERCRRIAPYRVRRRLTAREHWRLGRGFGLRRCCVGAFTVLAVLGLIPVYRRLIAGAPPARYVPCPLCAWSRTRVTVSPGCRCRPIDP